MNPKDKKDLESWIASREWYQSMTLSSGIEIKGKVPTFERERFFDTEQFEEKSVIDVGCNSGQFCLYAKRKGAKSVVGVDLDERRLEEAQVLTAAEGLAIDYRRQSLFDVPSSEHYDIVFCFAVVTEIQDLFGALAALKRLTRETLYLELDLAKPLLYISRSRSWLRPSLKAGRSRAVAEVRSSHGNLVVSPSLAILKEFFGPEYDVELLGKSVRYDMVRISRK